MALVRFVGLSQKGVRRGLEDSSEPRSRAGEPRSTAGEPRSRGGQPRSIAGELRNASRMDGFWIITGRARDMCHNPKFYDFWSL